MNHFLWNRISHTILKKEVLLPKLKLVFDGFLPIIVLENHIYQVDFAQFLLPLELWRTILNFYRHFSMNDLLIIKLGFDNFLPIDSARQWKYYRRHNRNTHINIRPGGYECGRVHYGKTRQSFCWFSDGFSEEERLHARFKRLTKERNIAEGTWLPTAKWRLSKGAKQKKNNELGVGAAPAALPSIKRVLPVSPWVSEGIAAPLPSAAATSGESSMPEEEEGLLAFLVGRHPC